MWSRERRLRELEAHARRGDVGWVEYLLGKTGDEMLKDLLDPQWWIGDATDRSEAAQRLRPGLTVTRHLLNTIPSNRLPKDRDIASYRARMDQAYLKLTAPNYDLKKPTHE
jgi:hypothetical protein